MINKTYKIYLAGTIYNDSPHSEWKSELLKYCDPEKYRFYDPEPAYENCYEHSYVVRDKAWISDSDALVSYIHRISAGTCMEIFYAYQFQTKHVILIDPDDMLNKNMWLSYHSHKIVRTVKECSEHIHNILL